MWTGFNQLLISIRFVNATKKDVLQERGKELTELRDTHGAGFQVGKDKMAVGFSFIGSFAVRQTNSLRIRDLWESTRYRRWMTLNNCPPWMPRFHISRKLLRLKLPKNIRIRPFSFFVWKFSNWISFFAFRCYILLIFRAWQRREIFFVRNFKSLKPFENRY